VHLVPDVMLERVVVRSVHVGCELDDEQRSTQKCGAGTGVYFCFPRWPTAAVERAAVPRCPRLTSCCARRRAGRSEEQRTPQSRCTPCPLSRRVPEALRCASIC
jgi:hypothetical protein